MNTSVFAEITRSFADQSVIWLQQAVYMVWHLLMAVLILILAKIALHIVSRITGHIIMKQSAIPAETDEAVDALRRLTTGMTLLRSVARYAIYFVAGLMILDQFDLGETAQNLLVTAGIGGLAIGFGAQSLVKDVVTGLFLMFESQFSVGDYVKIGDVEGTVTATALRATYLVNEKGQQIILPNGSITRVINYSRVGYSAADVTIMTSFAADTKQVMEVIREVTDAYCEAHKSDMEPGTKPEIRGIIDMTNAAVKYSVYCKTQPLKHWETERGLRLAIKEALDAKGIR